MVEFNGVMMAIWICTICAFAIGVVGGYFLIPVLLRLKFGQEIREIGPNWHKKKSGTPTMGGVMFIIGTIVSLILGFVYAAIFEKPFFSDLQDKFRFRHRRQALKVRTHEGSTNL